MLDEDVAQASFSLKRRARAQAEHRALCSAGQEITQFTYFQQAGGQALEIPSVEITYGLERIITVLQVCLFYVKTIWG